jgi:hypothetical protein
MSATEPRYCPISTLHRKLRQGTGNKGRARATVTRRVCANAGFYKYAVEEELLEHSPAAHVRRPRVDYEFHAAALGRDELGALAAPTSSTRSGTRPPHSHDLPVRAARSSPSARAAHCASDRPGHRRARRRTGVPSRGRRGGWTGTPLTSSPPTSQAPPANRSTSWKSSVRRSQPSDGAAWDRRCQNPAMTHRDLRGRTRTA